MTTISISSNWYTTANLNLFTKSDESNPVLTGLVKCSKRGKKEHRAYYYPKTGEFVVQEGDKRIFVNKSDFSII